MRLTTIIKQKYSRYKHGIPPPENPSSTTSAVEYPQSSRCECCLSLEWKLIIFYIYIHPEHFTNNIKHNFEAIN